MSISPCLCPRTKVAASLSLSLSLLYKNCPPRMYGSLAKFVCLRGSGGCRFRACRLRLSGTCKLQLLVCACSHICLFFFDPASAPLKSTDKDKVSILAKVTRPPRPTRWRRRTRQRPAPGSRKRSRRRHGQSSLSQVSVCKCLFFFFPPKKWCKFALVLSQAFGPCQLAHLLSPLFFNQEPDPGCLPRPRLKPRRLSSGARPG